MDVILIKRGDVQVGRLVLLGILADGMIQGVRYDMVGEARMRRQFRRAIETNSEGVCIRGGQRPSNLSLYADGVIAAAVKVAERLNLSVDIRIETPGILPGEPEEDTLE